MSVTVSQIEAETGLDKEVIRKWEIRYGFPRPTRDSTGARLYSRDQVVGLRLIARLLATGMRPSQVVGLDNTELLVLSSKILSAGSAQPDNFQHSVVDLLCRHDIGALTHLLNGRLHREGVVKFVQDTIAKLSESIGDAWLRGEVRIFEEHLYSQIVSDILHGAISSLPAALGTPRILLTTAPGELHTLGLIMARAVFGVEGAACFQLGAQTPVVEIADAAKALEIDIIAISASVAQPTREISRFLKSLRAATDPRIAIWAGGKGAGHLAKRIPGIVIMAGFDDALARLRSFRAQTASSAL